MPVLLIFILAEICFYKEYLLLYKYYDIVNYCLNYG